MGTVQERLRERACEIAEEIMDDQQLDIGATFTAAIPLSLESEAADLFDEILNAIIGWREYDWPEGFDRRSAQLIADRVQDILAKSNIE